jgi:hypothetical protein
MYGNPESPSKRRIQAEWLKGLAPADSVIWMGDFNETDGGTSSSPICNACANMTELLSLWDPEVESPTWTNCSADPDRATQKSRPDKCFVSNNLVTSVADVRVLSHVNYSDHLPILLQLRVGPTSGPAPSQRRQYGSKPIRELSQRARTEINSEVSSRLEGGSGTTVGMFWNALKGAVGSSPPSSSNRPAQKKDPEVHRGRRSR